MELVFNNLKSGTGLNLNMFFMLKNIISNFPIINSNVLERIDSIDFSEIKKSLMKKLNYIESSADLAIQEYKLFLLECSESGKKNIPSKIVDDVWHTHILYTKKYATDCQNIFGYFLHHEPSKISLIQDQNESNCNSISFPDGSNTSEGPMRDCAI